MKQIQIPNYNNKLQNIYFIHIDKAPSREMMWSEFPVKVHVKELVINKGGSSLDMFSQKKERILPIEFDAELIDFVRVKPSALPSVETLLSHGVTRLEFIAKYCSGENAYENAAIYIYRKS